MSKTISDIASVIDCLHATPEYSSSGYPMVRVENVKNDFLNLSECYLVDEATCDYHNKNYTPKRDDIIITRVGSFGLIALVDTDDKFCLGQNIAIISPYQNGKFLYYYLQSPYIQKFIHGNSGGSSYKSLSLEHIKRLPLVIDGLKISKIESILYNIDTKIHNNNAICADLEGMAKLLYDYWFVQFDFPDENGKPYKSSGGKMVWNEELKREIPDGWEVKPLSAVFDITMGSSPSGASLNENGDGIEFYQGSTDFGNIYPTKRVYTTAPVRFSKAQDVLLSVRAPVGTMNIAMNDCCIGRGLAAIHHFSTMFAWNTMLTFSAYFDIFNNNGTTFGALTSDDLKGQLTAVPPENLINKYHGTTIAIEKQIRNLSKENQELASLRDFLLPMLMNGQVTVKKGETQ